MLTEGVLQSVENKNINLKDIVFKYICSTNDDVPLLVLYLQYFMDNYDWHQISKLIHNKHYDASHKFIQQFKDKLHPALSAYIKYAIDEKDVPNSISNRIFVMTEKDFNEDNINESILFQEIPISVLQKYSKAINWKMISKYQNLSEETIELFANELDWVDISEYCTLSESFIEKHGKKVDWTKILLNQNISDFLEKNQHVISYYRISLYKRHLSEKFIRKHIYDLSMRYVIIKNKLSIEFIDEFFYSLDHEMVCKHQTLNDYIVRKYANVFVWYNIGKFQINSLSLDLIEENFNRFNWNKITRKILLKEDIIENFLHLLDPYNISTYQKLSIGFINRYFYILHFPSLLARQQLTEDIIDSYLELIMNTTDPSDYHEYHGYPIISSNSLEKYVWATICRYQKLSEDFIKRHLFYVDMSIVFKYQTLSEDFILRYYRRASAFDALRYCNLSIYCLEAIIEREGFIINKWDTICKYQKLPEDFIQKNITSFKFNDVLRYQILSEEFIEFNIKRIKTKCLGWDIIVEQQFLSFNFVKKYSKNLNLYNLKFYQKHLNITPYMESKFTFRKK